MQSAQHRFERMWDEGKSEGREQDNRTFTSRMLDVHVDSLVGMRDGFKTDHRMRDKKGKSQLQTLHGEL